VQGFRLDVFEVCSCHNPIPVIWFLFMHSTHVDQMSVGQMVFEQKTCCALSHLGASKNVENNFSSKMFFKRVLNVKRFVENFRPKNAQIKK
jgi:hypothetical protein